MACRCSYLLSSLRRICWALLLSSPSLSPVSGLTLTSSLSFFLHHSRLWGSGPGWSRCCCPETQATLVPSSAGHKPPLPRTVGLVSTPPRVRPCFPGLLNISPLGRLLEFPPGGREALRLASVVEGGRESHLSAGEGHTPGTPGDLTPSRSTADRPAVRSGGWAAAQGEGTLCDGERWVNTHCRY